MMETRSKDGTRIAFDRLGDGPAVILVGGAFSYRRFGKMIELAELLSERLTVINYDRRGRGDSGDTPEYAVERELEDLHALIDVAGGNASLWGWSSGGVLALRAAASGLPIEKVAVYEPPFILEDADHVPPADFSETLDALLAAGRRGAAVRHYMTQSMGVPGFFVTMTRLSPFWPKLKATAHTLPYDWAVLGDVAKGRPLVAAEWAAVTVPTLVIAGEKTATALQKGAEALAAALPNGRLRILERQSHNPSMGALAPVLAEFFTGSEDAEIASTPTRRSAA